MDEGRGYLLHAGTYRLRVSLLLARVVSQSATGEREVPYEKVLLERYHMKSKTFFISTDKVGNLLYTEVDTSSF